MFEQKYKMKVFGWWINKKKRIDQTIKDFSSKDPTVKAKAVAQTKVKISKRFVHDKLLYHSS